MSGTRRRVTAQPSPAREHCCGASLAEGQLGHRAWRDSRFHNGPYMPRPDRRNRLDPGMLPIQGSIGQQLHATLTVRVDHPAGPSFGRRQAASRAAPHHPADPTSAGQRRLPIPYRSTMVTDVLHAGPRSRAARSTCSLQLSGWNGLPGSTFGRHPSTRCSIEAIQSARPSWYPPMPQSSPGPPSSRSLPRSPTR